MGLLKIKKGLSSIQRQNLNHPSLLWYLNTSRYIAYLTPSHREKNRSLQTVHKFVLVGNCEIYPIPPILSLLRPHIRLSNGIPSFHHSMFFGGDPFEHFAHGGGGGGGRRGGGKDVDTSKVSGKVDAVRC